MGEAKGVYGELCERFLALYIRLLDDVFLPAFISHDIRETILLPHRTVIQNKIRPSITSANPYLPFTMLFTITTNLSLHRAANTVSA